MQICINLWSAAPWARFPTPIAAKAGPMPPHERLRLNDLDDLQNRRKPSIQLDKEPAIAVREPDPTLRLTPQNDQLMPAFSASSRLFDLNGATTKARNKHSSPIIPPA